MNKILIIAYYFPPMGMGGVQRPLKIAKYLLKHGWQPIVLTTSHKKLAVIDEYLLDEANRSGIIIERTGTSIGNSGALVTRVQKEGFGSIKKIWTSFFNIPDAQSGWKNKALKKADELWKKYDGFDLIFATAPPFTSFLIGQELKKKYKKNLVIDYRDPWVDSYNLNFYPTSFHKLLNEKKERLAIREANKVITTNRRTKELIIEKYNNIEYNDIKILPHLYDSGDIEFAQSKNLPYTTKLRITYTGSLYSRGLRLFFKSIKQFNHKYSSLSNEVEFLYLGLVTKGLMKMSNSYGIKNLLNLPGYVNHLECVKYLLASDALFLHIKGRKNSDAALQGAIGDYIGSRKYIVACIPDGVTKNTLTEYGAADFVQDYNPERIADIYKKLYDLRRTNSIPEPDEKTVQKYENQKHIEDLAIDFNYLLDVD